MIEQRSGLSASSGPTGTVVADGWEFGNRLQDLVVPFEGVPRFPLKHLGHDLFRPRELGKTAQLVYDRVGVAPGTTAEIADRIGRSRRTTTDRFTKLQQHELVDRRF